MQGKLPESSGNNVSHHLTAITNRLAYKLIDQIFNTFTIHGLLYIYVSRHDDVNT